LWKSIAENIEKYNTYPRIVGETGGKDFIFAHNSADIDALVIAAIRAAYEYQGQKCSAASRMYIPESVWPAFRDQFLDAVEGVSYGDVEDFSNFMGAVIDQQAFFGMTSYIDYVNEYADVDCLNHGRYDCYIQS